MTGGRQARGAGSAQWRGRGAECRARMALHERATGQRGPLDHANPPHTVVTCLSLCTKEHLDKSTCRLLAAGPFMLRYPRVPMDRVFQLCCSQAHPRRGAWDTDNTGRRQHICSAAVYKVASGRPQTASEAAQECTGLLHSAFLDYLRASARLGEFT